MENWILLLPVLIPVWFAIVLAADKPDASRRKRLVVTACVLTCIFCTAITFKTSPCLLSLSISSGLTFAIGVDYLGAVFLLLICSLWLLVAIFGFEYMSHEGGENRFYVYYLLVLSSLCGVALAQNFVTLYLFFEWMTLLTVPLVMHSRKKASIRAAFTYLGYSMLGAALALGSYFVLVQYSTDSLFSVGGILDYAKVSGNETVVLSATFVGLMGFGTKAGLVPMHVWLPTAHPQAPAPASAVLSGLITKGGLIAMLRLVYYMVGPKFLTGSWVQAAIIALATITVFVGSMLAYKEKYLKKRLAFSSVSQVSYAVIGLMMFNTFGLIGALLQMVFHALAKNVLFLCAGAIMTKTGCKRVDELAGIGKKMPITMWCFTIASLSLIGIPPTGGFLAKWYIAIGALKSTCSSLRYIAVIVLLVSAILTAGYLLPIIARGFFPGNQYNYTMHKSQEPTAYMTVPLCILSAALLILCIFSSPMLRIFTALSAQLI